MYFKQFLDEKLGCASYLIASRQTNEAAIVDPALVTDPYDELMKQRGFTLKYVIDTHVHADHVSGGRKLRDAYGAELCLFQAANVEYPFRGLRDSEELPLGQLRLKIQHSPGHRPELISVLVINPERSPEASMVLTGDSLLVGDVGRPDFGGGDSWQQYESVTRLLRLPDWVAVFPGHFEGPCGKQMCGRPSTTIGFERLFNPLAQLERERFISMLDDGVPARPLNMASIEATNRGTADIPWAMLTELSDIPDVSADELEKRNKDSLLLDVREPEEYRAGHVHGAISLPQSELASRIGELPRNRKIYVMCLGGKRSFRAAQFLAQTGFRDVVNVAGGMNAWRGAGKDVEESDVVESGRRIIETEWGHAGVAVH